MEPAKIFLTGIPSLFPVRFNPRNTEEQSQYHSAKAAISSPANRFFFFFLIRSRLPHLSRFLISSHEPRWHKFLYHRSQSGSKREPMNPCGVNQGTAENDPLRLPPRCSPALPLGSAAAPLPPSLLKARLIYGRSFGCLRRPLRFPFLSDYQLTPSVSALLWRNRRTPADRARRLS